MFQLDLKSRKPICEQIIDCCKHAIIDGQLMPGGRVPSVRELSARLTVNPNTIQKAYRQLESEGWIYTVAGRGAFVSEREHKADEEEMRSVYEQIRALVHQLKFMGVSAVEIRRRVEEMTDAANEAVSSEAGDAAKGNEERRDSDD